MTKKELLMDIMTNLIIREIGFEYSSVDNTKTYEHINVPEEIGITINGLRIIATTDLYFYDEELEIDSYAHIKYSDIEEVSLL